MAYDKNKNNSEFKPQDNKGKDFKRGGFKKDGFQKNKKPLSKFEEYQKKDFTKKNERLEKEQKYHNLFSDDDINTKVLEDKPERVKVWYLDYPDFVLDEGIQVSLECESLSYDAKGVCKVTCMSAHGDSLENYPIFVEGILPGEKGVVLINKMKSSFAEGSLIQIKRRNDEKRDIPICKNYAECGGCDIMHMLYSYQLEYKKEQVIETLEHIGGFENPIVEDVIGMSNPSKYRNKVQVPYCFNNFKTECGFYKKNTHTVVSMNECYIQSDLSSDIAKFIRNLCNEFKIKGFNERTNDGELKHVVLRETKEQKEIMVILVTKSEKVPCLDLMVKKILNRYPSVTTIVQNVNSENTNTVLSNKNIVLYGKGYIVDSLLDTDFVISPLSFYQVNSKQTEVLYKLAIEKANLNKDDVLIDAYCGIGTISLIASRYVKHVYGVEIVEDAIKNAKENAKINNIDNVTFVAAKAEEQIVKWKEENIKPTCIIVDPPRKGIEEVFLKTVVDLKIPKMVYVSCNPATLARDLRYLVDHGYDINAISPVDMFPYTKHVETVVGLFLKK